MTINEWIRILPNILVWKFHGSVQLPQCLEQITENTVETVRFHKFFTPENLVKFLYFTQCNYQVRTSVQATHESLLIISFSETFYFRSRAYLTH